MPEEHLPQAIATLPSDPEQWDLAASQQAVANGICNALMERNPEAVLSELVERRSVPPEVLALIRDGLLHAFQRMRTLLRSAREAPALASQLRTEATRILFEYFSEVRGTMQKLLSINADVMQHLSLLGTIMSTRTLNDFTDGELQDGLGSIQTLHNTEGRILGELTLRWLTEIGDENVECEQALCLRKMACTGNKGKMIVAVPYESFSQNQMSTLRHAMEAKFRIPGFDITFFDERECSPRAGEANFRNRGMLMITFNRS